MEELFPRASVAGVSLAILLAALLFLSGCGQDGTRSPFLDHLAKLVIVDDNSPYSFGYVAVGNSASHIFTIENQGNAPAMDIEVSFTLSAFSLTGAFPGTNGTCETTLGPGERCTIEVRYSPSYPDTFSEPLTVKYFDGLATQSTADGYVQMQLIGRVLGT